MIWDSLKILISVFFVLAAFMNFTNKYPRLPGDIILDKLGFTIRIPFASAIVITIIVSVFLNLF